MASVQWQFCVTGQGTTRADEVRRPETPRSGPPRDEGGEEQEPSSDSASAQRDLDEVKSSLVNESENQSVPGPRPRPPAAGVQPHPLRSCPQ
ncbi:Transcription factor 7-like 1 [Tupaia chinensis]|uniref:Transcription factor 7-like 1 n=1 Tax=Tupaia chinensis TaxID=246437 RepID=L9KSF5_TUPCH|nr:Transcription factor 7-like 1 [Tupaia chinensis]